MSLALLQKGLEVELFGGDHLGNVLPLSKTIKDKFPNFSVEPDQRSFEYITNPLRNYRDLALEIIEPRIQVRKFLSTLGNLTIIPGSTMPLQFSKEIVKSGGDEPYYDFIFKNHGTKVITTSLHMNFGIENNTDLFKLLSLLRLDAPLFLALSASSCFYDGNLTEYQSYRWNCFPKTPEFVPLFENHEEFIEWVNEQLNNKTMFNIRHLWTSVRPNGPNRPYDLNRVEVRICDLVSNTENALSVVALIELIIQNYLSKKNYPGFLKQEKSELKKIVELIDEQEKKVAKDGLNAIIWDWRNDTQNKASDIIQSLFDNLSPLAKELGIYEELQPIRKILTIGNEATEFRKVFNENHSISKTMEHFIQRFTMIDLELYKNLISHC